ncbi:MAG: MBL fold metallo-hydrolase [Bacteroidales bacterium]|nr:MBL fold metallo-hydrolase [Bacteroidales bacterium]
MVKFISLSSGSNGNCYYIGNDDVSLLIDLGIGGRTINRRLNAHDISLSKVDMVLVTHEHMDHIRYLGGFTQRYHKVVFVTEALHKVLERHFCTAGKLDGCVKDTRPGEVTECMGVKFIPFSVPHDARDTVGYYIDFFGHTFTFVTDVGKVTDDVVKYCQMASHLIVESNYDPGMLVTGPYTPELKKRISEEHGHLSNEQTADLLRRSCHDGLKSVFLCHLSANNNTPSLVFDSARAALNSVGGEEITLYALPRREASPLFIYD